MECINRLGFELKPSGVKEKKSPPVGCIQGEALVSMKLEQKKVRNILFQCKFKDYCSLAGIIAVHAAELYPGVWPVNWRIN